MYKPESVLENATHKIFWYFDLQTDHSIQARRQEILLINKKKGIVYLVDFAVSQSK